MKFIIGASAATLALLGQPTGVQAEVLQPASATPEPASTVTGPSAEGTTAPVLAPAPTKSEGMAPVQTVVVGGQPTVASSGNAPPASADPGAPPVVDQTPPKVYQQRFTGTVDVANVLWRTGSGYDLFSSHDAGWRVGLGIGYDFLHLSKQLVFAAEAGMLVEAAEQRGTGLLADRLEGTLTGAGVNLGASMRLQATEWFAPYGRVTVAETWYRMDIDARDPTYNSVSWTKDKWVPGASLGLGALFNLLPHKPVIWGALVEGGLWLQREVPIQLERSVASDAIATSGAQLGTLKNTGPYFRLAGVVRF